MVTGKKVTNDPNILNILRGYHIATSIQFSDEEKNAISEETGNFFQKRVIRKVRHYKGKFISSIFTTDKKTELELF